MNRIEGIIPPITTPFDANGDVNLALLGGEVRYLLNEARVQGLAVGGSTGEGHTLSTDELRQLVGETVSQVSGRAPVIAGIIVNSTRQAIERAKAVADLGVAALQITPVHYLFKPNDEMMYRHFATVADRVGLPIIVYNVISWSYCSPELLTRLITEVDGVIGVKQSARDLKLLADLLLMLEGQGIVMSAVDALLYPSFCLGAHGSISAIVTAAPDLSVKLWDAVRAGDHVTGLDLHSKLLRIWNAISGDNLPANVKCAMELQGRGAGLPRMPMPASSPAQKDAIRQALEMAGSHLQ